MKDDLKWQQKEKERFNFPGPGVYNTRINEHVGSVLIKEK